MVSINFCPLVYHLLTSGIILNSKMFQPSMFSFPSDRHAYHLKCFMHPMRYCFSSSSVSRLIYFMFSQGRLPYQVKSFVKYIRLDPPPPLYKIHVTKTGQCLLYRIWTRNLSRHCVHFHS